jgi:hypothetical protein
MLRYIDSATFDKDADMQDVERVILTAEAVSVGHDKAVWEILDTQELRGLEREICDTKKGVLGHPRNGFRSIK